jgi:hypothetical protein
LNPAAAIDYYLKAIPGRPRKGLWFDAVKTNNIYMLFTKVNTPPATTPDTVIWHFGWILPDSAGARTLQNDGAEDDSYAQMTLAVND